MNEYEIWLTDDRGGRIQPPVTEFTRLEWTRIKHDVGWLDVVLPGSYDYRKFSKGRRLYVWRKPQGQSPRLIRPYTICYTERGYSGAQKYLRLIAGDPNWLISSRVVAYDSTTAQADKNDYADDMMKEYVAENLGASAADTARDWSSDGITVESNASAGPTLYYEASYKQLLTVLQDIADAAETAGTRVLFDFAASTTTDMQFRTYIGQLGRDRRHNQGGNSKTLSLQAGNIMNPVIVDDARDEVNVVYGLGQGLYDYREVYEAEDTLRTDDWVFARREGTAQGGGLYDLDALYDAADTALKDGRPLRSFSAALLDKPGYRYQVDYDFGDLVTVEFDEETFGCEISGVHGVAENGVETLTAVLDYVW